MNIAAILPLKYPESRTLLMSNLPKSWNMYIISFGKKGNTEYLYKNFQWDLSKKDIIEEEKWLGFPLKLIGTMYKDNLKEEHFIYMANLVRFWRQFFEEKQIEVFLGRLEAFPNDTISLLAAKKMKISFIGISQKFATYALLLDEHGNPIFWKKTTKEDIKHGIQFFKEKYTDFGIDGRKIYSKKEHDYSGFLNEAYEKITLSKERRLEATPIIKSAQKPIEGAIKRIVAPYIQDKHLPNRKYFFFPLHYKYETYLYREFWYMDQYEIAKQAARCMLFDVDFVFRTHPPLKNSDAEIRKILEIKKIPNTRFVSWKIPSTNLIKGSVGVIRIFSTTLLEAMVYEKPSIVLFDKGYVVEEVNLHVNDIRDLPDAVNKIANDEFKMDIKKRDEFLGKLHKHYIPLEEEITRYGQIPTEMIQKELQRRF